MRSPPETNSQVADVSILVSSCPSCYCHSSAGTTQALCLEPARHPSWREAIGCLNLFLTCSSSLKQTMTMPRVLCLESFNHGHLLWSLDVDSMHQRIPEYLFSTGPASQNTCAWTPRRTRTGEQVFPWQQRALRHAPCGCSPLDPI